MSKSTPPIADSSPEDGFLTRWSRRKREIAASPQDPDMHGDLSHTPEPAILADQPEPAEVEAASPEAQAERDAVLARLPSLENIGKDTDITGFLNALVPDALRNAALRAAWSADPGIRDYLDDARDYALDYTAGGNAPGFGALGGTADDLKTMIGQIFGDAPAMPPERDKTLVAENAALTCGISDTESQPEVGAMQQPDLPLLATESVRLTQTGPSSLKLTQKQADKQSDNTSAHNGALQHDTVDVAVSISEIITFRRRGGGATPI